MLNQNIMKQKVIKEEINRAKLHDYVATLRPLLTYIATLRTNVKCPHQLRYLSEHNRLKRSHGVDT